jgi:very-short-patch-repair endonuclease
MYRCSHCRDLHLAAEQARSCAAFDEIWFEDALGEVERILERGPVGWTSERTRRDEADRTWPERLLWKALRVVLPSDAIRTQWWIPGCDYRVDLLVAPIDLVVEVDGASRQKRPGADRLRSSVIRSHGYQILRIPSEVALTDAAGVAGRIATRLDQELSKFEPLAVSA